MTLFERLCAVCEKTHLHRLSKKAQDPEFVKATTFLSAEMRVTPAGVVSASYCVGFLVLAIIIALLTSLGIAMPIIVLMSILGFLVSYYIVANYPISRMESYRVQLSEESDFIFEQFALVFQAGGTIFDAIEMVANSDHELLSAQFQEILAKVNSGVPPEECISNFAKNQPSADLRRYLLGILSALEERSDVLDALGGESFEADMSLRQRNLEIESRLIVVVALVTYLPIMMVLAISLGGYASNPMILALAPLIILLNAFLRVRFVRSFTTYFDRPQRVGISPPSQAALIEEYDEFLNFMILLGERLRLGDTLEVALHEVRDELAPSIQRIVDPALELIFVKHRSTHDAMETAKNTALGKRVASLIDMIRKMCEMSAKDAGPRISRIATRLIKRSALAKERNSIIAAQKVKVYILSFTSAMVLGLLSALAPFLNISQLLDGGFNGGWSSPSFEEVLPLLTTLTIITASSGYQNVKMVDGRGALFFSVICVLFYLLSFFISASLLSI